MADIDPIRDGQHYDALKAQEDILFYRTQAQHATGPVLEIGCGTGRVTLPIAADGVAITGLDISAAMLEEAERKAQQQGLSIRWVEADAQQFDLGQRYALLLMPFNVLQFFHDAQALQQVLSNVKKHLAPDGRFAFDVFNPQVSFLAADPQQRYERARYPDPHGSGEEIVLEETREYIADRQVIKSTRYYHLGTTRNRWIRTLELRCFFPCELDLLIQHHGFHMEDKLGNFDGTPFSSHAPKQILICSRAI